MTLDLDLDRLFAHEAWANREALQSLINAGDAAPSQAVRIMAHIIGASHLWLARLSGTKAPVAVWPSLGVDVMQSEIERLASAWQVWLATMSPARFDDIISYLNTKGEPWKSSVRDILAHLFLHASYHRGQIAILLGQMGGKAAYTDYIHAVRERLI